MFRLPACEAGPDELELLFAHMERQRGKAPQNAFVPAGYTYLGQFVDHDITFDPMSKLDDVNDPHSLVNFRTPRLDLDSLYGGGPSDQPFLYDWPESGKEGGTKLLVGGAGPIEGAAPEDLPRNQQGRALIGDPRNDEHVIIAQLHLLFIRFHNAVVDHLRERGEPEETLFDKAQRIVRWHYQWIVVHEYLPKVVGARMANTVLVEHGTGGRPTVRRRHYRWKREPFIPVEFSGAAFRFGHSMARANYTIREKRPGEKALSLFDHLKGHSWLREDRVLRWDLFFDLKALGCELAAQPSFAIDTSIASPLYKLPDGKGALPHLNLFRGHALSLPSGQRVATRMRVRKLNEGELLPDDQIQGTARAVLVRSTPLWYYILCEAATTLEDGQPTKDSHLGRVGGRIVAEVLVGLLEGDPTSYLHAQDPWQPGELGTGEKFEMIDLIEFAGAAPA
jgi:hypothetical protein